MSGLENKSEKGYCLLYVVVGLLLLTLTIIMVLNKNYLTLAN
jgi:hypothetical protein